MSTHCPVHNVPWKTVPAGYSMAKQKSYQAFQACPVQGCDQRPPKNGAPTTPTAPQGAVQSPMRPAGRTLADVRLSARVEAWKLSGAQGVGVDALYSDLMAAYTGTLPPMGRQPGEDEDLDAVLGPQTRIG